MKTILLLLTACANLVLAQLTELQPILEVAGSDTMAQLGEYVSGIGDINKDGYADVAVSIYQRHITQVYMGGNPMKTTPVYTLYGNSKVVTGDFNGDRWKDLSTVRLFGDSVFIYYGGVKLDTVPDVILKGEGPETSYGFAFAAGDFNGDGYSDIVVGAEDYSTTDTLSYRIGKMYVYAGGSTMQTTPVFTAKGDANPYRRFGDNIAVGDINNDGLDDIVVLGMLGVGSNNILKISIYLGKPNFQFTRDYYFTGQQDTNNNFDGFGIEIFDADGDGIKDIVLDGIFIYKGGTILDTLPSYRVNSPTTTFFGSFPMIYDGGDFNGDGVKDLLFGTSRSYPQGVRGFHIMFSEKGVPGKQYLAFRTFSGDRGTQLTGLPARNAGDVNGDGVDDVIIGAPGAPRIGQDTLIDEAGFFGIYAGDKKIKTLVRDKESPPENFALLQNYPNPFNPATTIEYSLSMNDHVLIKIFDSVGKEVKTLIDQCQNAGHHRVVWDGGGKNDEKVSSGIYYYQLQTGNIIQTKKAIMIK